MDRSTRINAFAALGHHLRQLTGQESADMALHARNENTWFTPESVRQALTGIGEFLQEGKLRAWVDSYPEPPASKRVGLILAGNIPLVGFHDLMSVLVSGHHALVKLSSKDHYLTKYIIKKLTEIEPGFISRITIIEQLKNFDAVIATGSDNSARYFDYYFGKYPHIIRSNRTSVAVLSGKEITEDLNRLGEDIFTYFGLGCRNVSKLFVPEGYEFSKLYESWEKYSDVVNHHKYANNYDYQKSILLINRVPFLDNGFVILQESERLVSPISVVFFEFYKSDEHLRKMLEANKEKIQVIVGKTPHCTVSYGEAQCPQLQDYADNVDTMRFLAELK